MKIMRTAASCYTWMIIRGDALASLFGALAETGTTDLTINGFSLSDGKSPDPSVSHKAGKNGDLRYLREDESGDRILLGQTGYDSERQNTFNTALHKFGWKDMISERYKDPVTGDKLLPSHTSSAKARGIGTDHSNHLHLQGYNPSLRVLYNGGELKTVTISAKQ